MFYQGFIFQTRELRLDHWWERSGLGTPPPRPFAMLLVSLQLCSTHLVPRLRPGTHKSNLIRTMGSVEMWRMGLSSLEAETPEHC